MNTSAPACVFCATCRASEGKPIEVAVMAGFLMGRLSPRVMALCSMCVRHATAYDAATTAVAGWAEELAPDGAAGA